jgi:anti-sigma regulatory factor (Ser/Thr protein kinase)
LAFFIGQKTPLYAPREASGMREISLNILDIAENSLKAGASLVEISIELSGGKLNVAIVDNGCGMTDEQKNAALDPFTTSRTERNVGLGLPFFMQAALDCGGKFDISSQVGRGTAVYATFCIDHLDCMPLGDVAQTVTALLPDAEQTDIVLNYQIEGRKFVFDTRELKREWGDIDFSRPALLCAVKEYLTDNINNTNGGHIL